MPDRDRRSPRWRTYDYRRPGLYFVTVCAVGRREVFGAVEGGAARLSSLGEVAAAEWTRTVEVRGGVVPDVFVVMPNHVHLLFGIVGDDCPARDDRPAQDMASHVPTDGTETDGARRFGGVEARSVSAVVGGYKSAVTRHARRLGLWARAPLWQGRFHDRVVRSGAEADHIRRYIAENPARWTFDRFHPARLRP